MTGPAIQGLPPWMASNGLPVHLSPNGVSARRFDALQSSRHTPHLSHNRFVKTKRFLVCEEKCGVFFTPKRKNFAPPPHKRS